MNGKEKLYFLLERIIDVRDIAPIGQALIIDPTNDLNRNYTDAELLQLFTKLESDELLPISMRKSEKSIVINRMLSTLKSPNYIQPMKSTI